MPLQERDCGECNACCFLFNVHDDLFKTISEAREWCSHCERGVGCRIYDRRPTACRSYTCFWKSGALQDGHRPDKWGVVIDISEIPGQDIRLIFFRELYEGRLDSERVQFMMNGLVKSPKNFIIACYLDGSRKPIKPVSMSEEEALAFITTMFDHWGKVMQEYRILPV